MLLVLFICVFLVLIILNIGCYASALGKLKNYKDATIVYKNPFWFFRFELFDLKDRNFCYRCATIQGLLILALVAFGVFI